MQKTRSITMKLRKSSGRLWLTSLASVLFSVGLSTQARADIKDGLQAYWNFDAKNFKDSVGKFDGTENPDELKPIVFVDGKPGFGQAIKLDGPSDSGGSDQ